MVARRIPMIAMTVALVVAAAQGAFADDATERLTLVEQAYAPGGIPEGAAVVNDYTIKLKSGDLLAIDQQAIIDAAGLPQPDAVEDCVSDLQCWWADTDYSGVSFMVYDPGDDGVPWTDVPASFNNTMASWRNHDAQDAKWAKGSTGGGAQYCMDERSRDPNVTPNRNTMTSFRVYGLGANPC